MKRRTVLKSLVAAPAALWAQAPAGSPRVQHIDVIHHSHTDVGYTDLPSVCRELQVRFLDAALDTCRNDARFRWTAESTLTVRDWWTSSPPDRRNQLLETVRRGQMDIMALPFNQAPFMNAAQWDQAIAWLPDSLWRELKPAAAMQNDVNGFPRAGALRLLDRGIRRLLMGINADSGGPPFRRPTAFWWRMPDGRRIFVWLGDHYGAAYGFFEAKPWIRGQPKLADTSQDPPRPGEVMRTDEPSLRAAHARLLDRLRRLEQDGYDFDRLILSYTNQWRYDNDPPFPPLAAFIEAWNRLGLRPALRLATATEAVRDMERATGDRIRTFEGEWTDWWANGDASGPREVAASRFAKRSLAAALSPVWGPFQPAARPRVERMLRDLCLFDEHTWGANISINEPYSLDTIGQYTEKSLLAYRPRAGAEALLVQRARTRLASEPEGVYVVNPGAAALSGWASFTAAAARGEYRSVRDMKTGRAAELVKEGGSLRFWVDDLAAGSIAAMKLEPAEAKDQPAAAKPEIESGPDGWPESARWPGISKPLFLSGTGDFVAVVTVPPADRRTIARMHATADREKREAMRRTAFKHIPAEPGRAAVEENAHTLVCRQPFDHPRLANATRVLELWKAEPRARLTLRFDRISSLNPEVFYVNFALPAAGTLPKFSNGGVPFVPYRDQLEGSCRDYFAVDGWALYETPGGHWLWATRDAPLVTVGGPHTVERHTDPPADTHRLMAMIFDNCWHTNFVADSHGTMEFRFDLVWRSRISQPAELAEALVSDPVVVINRAARQSPELLENLYRP